MKLIDVAEFYSDFGGGVKTYIQQKLEASKALGVDLTIIAPGEEDRIEQRNSGKIIWVKSPIIPFDKRYHIFNKIKPIHELLDQEAPDFVEGSSQWLGGKAVATWQRNIPKGFFVHQDPVASYPQLMLEKVLTVKQVDWLFGWFWRYMRNLTHEFDTTVVSAPWLAERLSGLGFRQLKTIPFGIDKSLFSPDFRDPELKRELLAECGIYDPNAVLLVSVSRHHPEKRIKTMIEATHMLNKKQPVGLYIIGDGPVRKQAEQRAAKGLGVCVAGTVNDRNKIARILASADAMVHCCASETFGLVIAEAMCSGLPLVVPQRGGSYDLSTPAFAESHKVADAQSCTDAIERLLSRPHEELRNAAANAGQAIHRPQDHFRGLFEHYQTLIKQRISA